MMSKRPIQILVVDDDRAMREMLASLLKESGYWVEQANSGDEALELGAETDFDAVLSDIRMPGRSGIELGGALRKTRPDTPVILMTAFGTIDSAVDAMRAGAFDYITKPFEPDALLLMIERALERRHLEQENQLLRRAVDRTSSMGELIGESPAMREIFALIRKIGPARSSVLITGESGTGKEVVARTIHYQGARAEQPFIPINCTALPEGLLESELFGHTRGAFTGAHASKRGLFEKANGGTLLLDEIGDMGPSLQSKLLRVLQDGEIRPVGGTEAVKVDVRIIAATNRDLEKEMSEGRFREDLFYRLNVIPLRLPPLRERPEDIPALAEAFLRRHAGDRPISLAPDAIAALCAQAWRGNGRELENTIERAIALTEGNVIEKSDLGLVGTDESGPSGSDFLAQAVEKRLSLDDLQQIYTEAVLDQLGGNKVQAARILGIDRKTLYRRAERRERENVKAEAEAKTAGAEA